MTLRTATILSLLITGLGTAAVVTQGSFPLPGDQVGYQPVQPVNFSHRVHAGDNRISCLYCHSSAERSSVAGVPAVSTCMNCHREVRPDSPEVVKIRKAFEKGESIQWVRVHRLPDHAVFNHSRHVNSGVACRTCHGPVETMDRVAQATSFTMGFCVDCHRSSAGIPASDSLVAAGVARNATLNASTDCSVCHH